MKIEFFYIIENYLNLLHSFTGLWLTSGMNPKTLQYLMWHSDISVTLNVYTHVNIDDTKAEIAILKVV